MYRIIGTLPVGKNITVTLSGICDIRTGSVLRDKNGKVFEVLGVGLTKYEGDSKKECC